MAFTDRFIKIPIGVYNRELKALTGNEDVTDSWMKFSPFELASYRPTYTDEEPDIEIVNMTLKGGDSTLVYLSVQEFEDLLNFNNATDQRYK